MKPLERPLEQGCIRAALADGECCAVVGVSNSGKSTLLRSVQPTDPQTLLFYVDCNRMLELSEQGFYEAVLRAVRSGLREQEAPPDLAGQLEEDYHQVVEPRTPFSVPMGFSDALERLCENRRRVVLILDEFDEPFEALEGRTFLNLRALRDRYRKGLVYVTGTSRTLEEIRDDPQTVEFREMFVGRVCLVGMLSAEATSALIQALAADADAVLTAEEAAFVARAAGGHPGLLGAVVWLLLHARALAPQTYQRMGVRLVAAALAGDAAVRGECEKLWEPLTVAERRALLTRASGAQTTPAETERLQGKGLLTAGGKVFGEVFADFVRRRSERRSDLPAGVWLDEDAGEVYVDGRQAPTLTDLEYRLLHALYERRDKLCDKYLLVEKVWGESYIDQVDDARIEKLVSRVRAKIEDDPANPRILVTVRGRGYQLKCW